MDERKVKGEVRVKSLSRVRLFATPWTVAYQAPLSMGFSRQEYWSGLPFPSPGDHFHVCVRRWASYTDMKGTQVGPCLLSAPHPRKGPGEAKPIFQLGMIPPVI